MADNVNLGDRVQLPEDEGGHVGFVIRIRRLGRRRPRLLTIVTEQGYVFAESHVVVLVPARAAA